MLCVFSLLASGLKGHHQVVLEAKGVFKATKVGSTDIGSLQLTALQFSFQESLVHPSPFKSLPLDLWALWIQSHILHLWKLVWPTTLGSPLGVCSWVISCRHQPPSWVLLYNPSKVPLMNGQHPRRPFPRGPLLSIYNLSTATRTLSPLVFPTA